MRTKNIAILASIIFVFLIGNQLSLVSQIQWQRTIGGGGIDEPISIIQAADSGYVAAGVTRSFGGGMDDFYIVKLDKTGTLQWTSTIGGATIEIAYSVIQTTDGTYLAAGYTNSFGAGNYDAYFVKISASGSIQWNKTLGGTANDLIFSTTQTTDGGYAAAGLTRSSGAGGADFLIIKFDGNSVIQWSRTIGGPGDDVAYSIIKTTDGGYAVAGSTSSFGAGSVDMYILKLNANGVLQWSKTIGGIDFEAAQCIIQTTDRGFAVAGGTNSFGVSFVDSYIIKLDSAGTLLWSRTFGATGDDNSSSIIQTQDGGYITYGTAEPSATDAYMVKLDSNGVVQWSKGVGGANYDYGWDFKKTADGGYVAAASTSSFGSGNYDIYIIKFDGSWNTCGNSFPAGITNGTGGTATSPSSEVGFPSFTVMSPVASTGSGGIVTPVCLVGIQPVTNEIPELYKLYQNYPNPFNPKSKIKFQIANTQSKNQKVVLSIYNILGEEIAILVNEVQNAGTYEVEWNAANYSSGVYYYQLTVSSEQLTMFKETRKMVLIK